MGPSQVSSLLTSGPEQNPPQQGRLPLHGFLPYSMHRTLSWLSQWKRLMHPRKCLQCVQRKSSTPKAVSNDACHMLDLPRKEWKGRFEGHLKATGLPPRRKASKPILKHEAKPETSTKVWEGLLSSEGHGGGSIRDPGSCDHCSMERKFCILLVKCALKGICLN